MSRGARNATLERQWTFLEPYSRTFITISRPGTDLVALAEEQLPILVALRARDGRRAARATHTHLMQAAKLLREHSDAKAPASPSSPRAAPASAGSRSS